VKRSQNRTDRSLRASFALVKWAGRLVESNTDDYVFPACEAAGIEREHPDRERIDPSRPIKSWRSAWRAALKRLSCRCASTTSDTRALRSSRNRRRASTP
jgi:hypothetical protein